MVSDSRPQSTSWLTGTSFFFFCCSFRITNDKLRYQIIAFPLRSSLLYKCKHVRLDGLSRLSTPTRWEFVQLECVRTISHHHLLLHLHSTARTGRGGRSCERHVNTQSSKLWHEQVSRELFSDLDCVAPRRADITT